MAFRKLLSAAVGLIQGIMGGFAIAFAYFLYYGIFDIQNFLGLEDESNMPLYLFLLLIFGLFSIVSGVSLIHEWLESR